MSDYVKLADYAAKDALATGDLAKVVRGTELGADFDAIATAIATKYDSADLGVTLQEYNAQTIVFASGTKMLFYSNTAPTGWTKDTTAALDNTALRIVSDGSQSGGNGGVTGGTATFNACFGASKSTGSYTLQVADIPSHNHGGTTGNDSPDHTHNYYGTSTQQGVRTDAVQAYCVGWGASASTGALTNHTHTISSQGGGGGHAHTINFDVRYASFIVASKD